MDIQERLNQPYGYLSDHWKRDFALLYQYHKPLEWDHVLDWNHDNSLGLMQYQMDDLVNIDEKYIKEWLEL
ncbi:hypothetical protein [Vibrio phage VCPH]|nr:hypothetical protein [Vibrio phage VCPH]